MEDIKKNIEEKLSRIEYCKDDIETEREYIRDQKRAWRESSFWDKLGEKSFHEECLASSRSCIRRDEADIRTYKEEIRELEKALNEIFPEFKKKRIDAINKNIKEVFYLLCKKSKTVSFLTSSGKNLSKSIDEGSLLILSSRLYSQNHPTEQNQNRTSGSYSSSLPGLSALLGATFEANAAANSNNQKNDSKEDPSLQPIIEIRNTYFVIKVLLNCAEFYIQSKDIDTLEKEFNQFYGDDSSRWSSSCLESYISGEDKNKKFDHKKLSDFILQCGSFIPFIEKIDIKAKEVSGQDIYYKKLISRKELLNKIIKSL